jgi:hypothetical protein
LGYFTQLLYRVNPIQANQQDDGHTLADLPVNAIQTIRLSANDVESLLADITRLATSHDYP